MQLGTTGRPVRAPPTKKAKSLISLRNIGLLSALPQLVSTWAQLAATSRLAAAHTKKSLILFGAWAQACWWAPLGLLPLMLPNDMAACALIGPVVVHAALGHVTVPP